LLGQIEGHASQRVVIADMEAGAGTLTRLPEGSLDVALLVVEPSAKSIDVARRAHAIITERQIGLSLIVANRVRDADDLALIGSSFPGVEVVAIPEDQTVTRSDREALSPIDIDPDSPAVLAVIQLAARLGRWGLPVDAQRLLPVVE
jgi:CO dehydrogenase maturation factor